MQLSLQELEKDITKLESELQLTRDESKAKEKEQHDEIESLRQEIQLKQVEKEELKKEVHRLKEQVQLLQDDNEYLEEQMREWASIKYILPWHNIVKRPQEPCLF